MIKILFETALTDVKKTDVEGVGVLRYGQLGRVYRWVKNRSATTALVAKQAVCYDEAKVGTKSLYESVEECASGNVMLAAGIVITALVASASDALCYGWVQVQGYFQDAIVMPTNTVVGIGDELNVTAGADYLDFNKVDGVAPGYSNHFIALEVADTTSGSTEYAKDVSIRCL